MCWAEPVRVSAGATGAQEGGRRKGLSCHLCHPRVTEPGRCQVLPRVAQHVAGTPSYPWQCPSALCSAEKHCHRAQPPRRPSLAEVCVSGDLLPGVTGQGHSGPKWTLAPPRAPPCTTPGRPWLRSQGGTEAQVFNLPKVDKIRKRWKAMTGWKEAEWKGSQEETSQGRGLGKGTQAPGTGVESQGECGPWLRREAKLRCRAQRQPPPMRTEGTQKWARGGQAAEWANPAPRNLPTPLLEFPASAWARGRVRRPSSGGGRAAGRRGASWGWGQKSAATSAGCRGGMQTDPGKSPGK